MRFIGVCKLQYGKAEGYGWGDGAISQRITELDHFARNLERLFLLPSMFRDWEGSWFYPVQLASKLSNPAS